MASTENKMAWTEWASLTLSVFTILFPYLFPGIFPEGIVPYYAITIPLGAVAAGLAFPRRNLKLMALGAFAGASPLVLIAAVTVILQIVFLLTGGRYPGPEWL